MAKTITFTKAAFAGLLDEILFPNPDDVGPVGPGGPIIYGPLEKAIWGMLNPQPLPPKEGDLSTWAERSSPQPIPWRMAFLARALIDRVVAQYQFAEVLGSAEQSDRAIGVVRSYIRDIVDDWCGTRPPRWPWPRPHRVDGDHLRPIELFAAGAQFQKAAGFDNPLQADFSAAADQLLEAGLKQLESRKT